MDLGFQPAFLLIRGVNSPISDWGLMDTARSPYNPSDIIFLVNENSAEYTASDLDFLANGFKLRSSTGISNRSAQVYVYAAFAEYPFGGDGATPATAF